MCLLVNRSHNNITIYKGITHAKKFPFPIHKQQIKLWVQFFNNTNIIFLFAQIQWFRNWFDFNKLKVYIWYIW